MDKLFNHIIICLTFVMPVAALTGCAGSNGADGQSTMGISSCVARGEDGQYMPVKEFGMFVADGSGRICADNIPVRYQSGKWVFADIDLTDGEKDIYAYYPYNASALGGKISLDARTQADYLCSRKTTATAASPSVSIILKHLLSKAVFRVQGKTLNMVKTAGYKYSASYDVMAETLVTGPEKGEISSSEGCLLLYPGDNPAMPLSLSVEGKDYDFIMPAIRLQPGKEYTYTLTVNGNGVEITDISLSQWQPGENYEGVITEK